MSMNGLPDLDWEIGGPGSDWPEPTPDPGAVPALDEWSLPPLPLPQRHQEQPQQPQRPAGPLVAVCSLCGGAGATTIAYLIARAAAGAAAESVLVCDTGGPTGGLAVYAGVETPRSLPHVADAVAVHEPLGDALFAHAHDGLRVLASRPELGAPPDPDGLARVLVDARGAHGLSIVDCGLPSGEIERQVLAAASHVVWVLPATLGGIRRARAALALFGTEASRREIVVARGDAAGRRPPTHELTDLAATRGAPLVLMPHVPDLGEQSAERALELAGLSLDAIRMELRR